MESVGDPPKKQLTLSAQEDERIEDARVESPFDFGAVSPGPGPLPPVPFFPPLGGVGLPPHPVPPSRAG